MGTGVSRPSGEYIKEKKRLSISSWLRPSTFPALKEQKWKDEVQHILNEFHKETKDKDATIRHLKEQLFDYQKGRLSDGKLTQEALINRLHDHNQDLENKLEQKNDVIRNLQRSIVNIGFQTDKKEPSKTPPSDPEVSRLKEVWGSDNKPSGLNAIPKHANDRFGISAETAVATKLEKSMEGKTQSDIDFLRSNLLKNNFLRGLDSNQIDEMIACMNIKKFIAGKEIVRQNEMGDQMYLIKNGEVEVCLLKNGKSIHVTTLKEGAVFGELAILYNCKRTATCKSKTSVTLWSIDRKSVQTIVKFLGQERLEEYVRLLKTVDKLKELPVGTLMRIADCLEPQKFKKNDYIIREGESGDTFYVIQGGQVKITKNKNNGDEEVLATMAKGQFFGERALLTEDKRTANVVVTTEQCHVLVLERSNFSSLVGNLDELGKEEVSREFEKEDEEYEEILQNLRTIEEVNFKVFTPSKKDREIVASTPLSKLQMLAVLGQGGFGFVKLCKVPGISKSSFALKAIKKAKIVKQGQQQHVIAEKEIQMALKSPFCGRLYKTFKDDARIYLLMDSYLGGELYGVLRKVGPLKDGPARFCAACTLEALNYLHERGIVYRDLKPENLMVDHRGYIILIDFGFAKKIKGGHKTWTFCGTPEYFPPEVLSNAGHDISADYWSFGILIYELLTMTTPFYAQDDMMIYEKILGGIDGVKFSPKVKKPAENLIRSLCKLESRSRLGNMKGGVQDIRKHRWFQGFNWQGLRSCKLDSPFDPDVTGPTDVKHFPKIPASLGDGQTADEKRLLETSNMGWDSNF